VEQRIAMVNATIRSESTFELSRVEIDRPGPHFAVDTVQILREEFPDSELYYLMGSDSVNDLPDWHRPLDFVARCDYIGVMCRPGDDIKLDELEPIIPGISTKVVLFEAPLLEIASQEIRQRVRSGRQYRFFLVPGVADLIRENNLYTD
jgi:nicotinate-nucleotide adenylyltransferase